jgi:diguanylate cyclase (GGDEF)-like protein
MAGETMRILMIEDMPVVANSTRDALMVLDGNIRFDIADSLAAALGKIESGNRYDIALVDLSLPDASGSDAPRTIRTLCPEMVIVVVTGDESCNLALDLVRIGIQDYVPKSEITPQRLLRTIQLARERHQRELMFKRSASLDPLTGTLNRRGLERELQKSLAMVDRLGLSAALCTVDIDYFKSINDHFGHPAGDGVLIECARRLREHTRANDHVGRAGGDEFWVVLDGLTPDIDLASAADKLIGCFRDPCRIETGIVPVSASIGIAIAPQSAGTVEEWIRKSDEALYAAKRDGRDCWRIYQELSAAAPGRMAGKK